MTDIEIKGLIGTAGLGSWWLATFSEDERDYIERLFQEHEANKWIERRKVGVVLSLTKGSGVHHVNPAKLWARVVALLQESAPHLSQRFIAKFVELKAEVTLHHIYGKEVKERKNYADDPNFLRDAVAACERQIAIAPGVAAAMRDREESRRKKITNHRFTPETLIRGFTLPYHDGYAVLAGIRKMQGNETEVLRLHQEALDQGWKGPWTVSSNPMVWFDEQLYKYPHSVRGGAFPRLLLDKDLSEAQSTGRREWINRALAMATSAFGGLLLEKFRTNEDYSVLRSIIPRYGVFVLRFFEATIRFRVIEQFAKTPIDLTHPEWQMMGYQSLPHDPPTACSWICLFLFDFNVLRAIQDPQVVKQIEYWYEKHKQLGSCCLCGQDFRPIDLPDWLYYGSNGCNNCCFACSMPSPTRDELPPLIRQFVDSCGFIPSSECEPGMPALSRRVAPDRFISALRSYRAMGGIHHVITTFGTWFKALRETRILPEGVWYTARGTKCVADDGHECNSFDERIVDNWLASRKIPHVREPAYPYDPSFNPRRHKRADWKVGNVFIEYFGLMGDEKYERRALEKILFAKSKGLQLIGLYTSDLDRLEEKLGHLSDIDLQPFEGPSSSNTEIWPRSLFDP